MWQLSMPGFRRALATELSSYLNTQVEIDGLRLRSTGVTLAGVRVRDPSIPRDGTASLVEVDHLEVPFSLALAADLTKPDRPAVKQVVARGVRATIIRDSAGQWNVTRLIPPSEGPPGRNWIGAVRITKATVTLIDHSLPREPGAPALPAKLMLRGLDGSVWFDGPGETAWAAHGRQAGTPSGSVSATGRYEAVAGRLLATFSVDGFGLPAWVNGLLPSGVSIRTGTVTGTAVLASASASQSGGRRDAFLLEGYSITADARLSSLAGELPWVRGPVEIANGHLTMRDRSIGGDLNCRAGGETVRVSGALRLGHEVAYDVTAFVRGADTRRVIAALKIDDALIPVAVRAMKARASADVRLYGVGARAQMSGYSTAVGGGGVMPDIALGAATRAQALISGPVANPRIQVTVAAPHVRLFGGRATNVAASINWSGSAASYRVRADAYGGRVAASGSLRQKKSGPAWSLNAHVRDADISRLRAEPAERALADLGWTGRLAENTAGRLSCDLQLAGRSGERRPTGRGIVQVLAPKYDNVDADRFEAAADLTRAGLTIHRALVERGQALAVAQGRIDPTSLDLSLDVECNRAPLAMVAQWAGIDDVSRSIGGIVDLRDGRIEGNLRSPLLKGALYATGLRYEDWDADYATAFVEGQPGSIAVDGEVLRLPSVATCHGYVRRPFSSQPWLTMAADAQNIDIREVAEVAGSDVDIAGIATAGAFVNGPISATDVDEFTVQSDRIWAGDLQIEGVSAFGGIGSSNEGYRVRVDGLAARIDAGVISGRGSLEPDGTLTASIRTSAVPLTALSTYWAGYADVRGEVDGVADVSGRLQQDEPLNPRGRASLATRGLVINGEDFGELSVDAMFDGDRVTGFSDKTDNAVVRLGEPGRGIAVTGATYNLESGAFACQVGIEDIAIDPVRRAFERSPATMGASSVGQGHNAIAGFAPVSGSASAVVRVSGTRDDYELTADIASSSIRIGEVPLDGLAASVQATRDKVVLRSASVQAGDMIVSGAGELEPGKRIAGTASADGVELSMLAQWLPAESVFRGIEGTVDTISAEVSGTPDSPEVTLYAAARGVTLKRSEAEGSSGLPFAAPAVRLSGVSVREGRASFDDLAVTLGPTAAPEQANAPPIELHASGEVPFSWKAPYVADDAKVNVTVRLPEQGLESVQALAGAAPLELKGIASAQIGLSGMVRDLSGLISGEEISPDAVDITGEARIKAERIRALSMRTMLADVDLAVRFADGLVEIGPTTDGAPSARVHLLGPGTDAVAAPAGDIRVSGRLPVLGAGGADDVIRIVADEVRFDEAPLPRFATGRVAGRLGAADGQPGLSATVSGSVMTPHIAGRIAVRQTGIRLPVSDPLPTTAATAGIIDPTFDLAMIVGDGVTVTSTQLAASLSTAPALPIRLTGSLSKPSLAGTLVIGSGSLVFPTARFSIVKGGLVRLRYPDVNAPSPETAGLDVSLDVTATSRITATSVTGVTRRYLVTATARGSLLERDNGDSAPGEGSLKLTYRTEPPDLALSQAGISQRITALLGGKDAIEAAFSRGGDVAGVLMGHAVDYLGGALLPGLIEQTGLGRSLGLDELSVDYSRTGAFVLRLSRTISGPLVASYSRRLSGRGDTLDQSDSWELRLGVRLNRAFRLSWSHASRQANAYLVEGVYSF